MLEPRWQTQFAITVYLLFLKKSEIHSDDKDKEEDNKQLKFTNKDRRVKKLKLKLSVEPWKRKRSSMLTDCCDQLKSLSIDSSRMKTDLDQMKTNYEGMETKYVLKKDYDVLKRDYDVLKEQHKQMEIRLSTY